ncbi:magnesium transporter [Nitrosopumilus sp. b1]|uniref:magnesium transporter CorA family protein n=1 Tax=Nitrosopumilus sp. b1 TaxID=2109907 RepID=UPI0015F76AE0|nr:magnesium transporter CorA family protein [Nitrosopumilus sp. b1]KAF6242326.1 magnesium transporter [Nitrosopumilus sp. b1]
MKREFITKKLRAGKKLSESSGIEQKVETVESEKFTWIDLQNPDRAYVEKLAKQYNLNSLNIEDCLTKFELPKLDSYSEHIFLILHFPPLASSQFMPKYSQLSVFLGKNFLITVHQGDLKPLLDLVNICKGDFDPERKKRLLGKSTGMLLHEIIDVLVDDLLHTLRKIVANLDEIEEGVFDEKKSAARKISVLRREITMLRRIVNPLKRIVLETTKHIPRFSETDLTLYFDDIIDHIDKVIDTLEESRETMEIYKDTDFMLSTEKTNKVLAVLTIIFTLAIPATVIGTFYGMNVNLPGGIESVGSDGGYTTFIIVILASVIPAGLMFMYFRKLGWLSD